MGLGKLVGGVVKLGVATVAVAGICSFFKEEIRETEAYKKANEKYDVDTKVKKASEKVKSTTMVAARKVSETAKTVKEKAGEKWGAAEDEAVAEDEIILDDAEPADRDYVNLEAAAEDAAEKASDVADEAVDAAKEAVESAADDNIVLD